MRKQFEMTQDQLDTLLKACRPVPMIALQCGNPSSPQENANGAWCSLGKEMGFDGMTVEPVPSKGDRFFTAVPTKEEAASKCPECDSTGWFSPTPVHGDGWPCVVCKAETGNGEEG